MRTLRALISDDHQLFREGLKQLLIDLYPGAEVREAACMDEALQILMQDGAGDVIFTDLRMPGMSLEALEGLRDGFANARLVVVSGFDSPAEILAALAAGIHGYIPKCLPAAAIASAITEIMDGGVFVPAHISRQSTKPLPSSPSAQLIPNGRLTRRQSDVLDQPLMGTSTKEIARILNISEGTVKVHLASIYRALGVRTRAEAIAQYRRKIRLDSGR